MKPKIVICGATGNQGSAVVKALANVEEIEVIALTRSAHSPKAEALKSLGITMQEADLLNRQSLEWAFKDAGAVFGVTQPWNASYTKCDTDAEMRQGRNIMEAAKVCGVKHLVFSSVLSFTNEPMGIKHADSKLQLEAELRSSGVPFTILRCAQFMDNIGTSFFPVSDKRVKGFVDKEAVVPYVCCKDIGQMSAQVLLNPAAYKNETVDLIGDMVSGSELSALLSGLRRKPIAYKTVPSLLLRLFAPEFYTMRRAFEHHGRGPGSLKLAAGMKTFRKYVPEAMDMDMFLNERFSQ